MIEHATTCDPGDEIYSYRVAEENSELLFNDLYDLVGMISNGFYVPVRDLDQFQKLKMNNWKMSAYQKFEERENSGCLIPDYFMRNGSPARALPPNNETASSVQAGPAWKHHNDMASQQDTIGKELEVRSEPEEHQDQDQGHFAEQDYNEEMYDEEEEFADDYAN